MIRSSRMVLWTGATRDELFVGIAPGSRRSADSLRPVLHEMLIPPADIRYRVVSQPHSEDDYRQIGLVCATAVADTMRAFGNGTDRPLSVLDFGCGCSRTIQPLHEMFPHWNLHGTDIDPIGIEWSAAHIPYATFGVNDRMPPTPYADHAFDLVYALSVFTHLNLKMEKAWLRELTRLLNPGGFLFLTFNGRATLNQIPHAFPDEVVKSYERDGFAYFANIKDGVLPDWYQTSIQTAAFLRSQIPPNSAVVHHVEGGISGWQDTMLVRRQA
jgi:2-polyprenyl-3-methyl-5-hydroxy-6-metoxy-1,4-benzoquinol methylase